MFEKCGCQVRTEIRPYGMGFVSRPYGLDMNAVLALAQAHDALGPLFFDCLPAVERIIVSGPEARDIEEEDTLGDAG